MRNQFTYPVSWKFIGVGLSILWAASSWAARPATRFDPLENWLKSEYQKSTVALLANISPAGTRRGVVVASPSRAEPNYFYFWVRDAALTMDAVVGLYSRATQPDVKNRLAQTLLDYVKLSHDLQMTPNPSGGLDHFFQGLGEPKFNVDGSPYTEPWGRPQNDGPALRAITLIHLAKVLQQERRVRFGDQLYDRDPRKSVLKADLEFVSHHWQETCVDLWEEVRGHHFYTQMVQRRALIEGALIARAANDPGAADWYLQQARGLEQSLQRFWDPQRGYIVTTLDRDGGLDYKHTNLDASVILASLHSLGSEVFFAPIDDRILATAVQLERAFRAIYKINEVQTSPDGQRLGVAIGRYPEDRYNGLGSGEGNPWVLLTAGFAELHYRAAHQWSALGKIAVTPVNVAFFKTLSGLNIALQPGEVIQQNDPRFRQILQAMQRTGDEFMRRNQYHAFPDGSLSEEINRYTGFMQGARDLTWNYASILTSLWSR